MHWNFGSSFWKFFASLSTSPFCLCNPVAELQWSLVDKEIKMSALLWEQVLHGQSFCLSWSSLPFLLVLANLPFSPWGSISASPIAVINYTGWKTCLWSVTFHKIQTVSLYKIWQPSLNFQDGWHYKIAWPNFHESNQSDQTLGGGYGQTNEQTKWLPKQINWNSALNLNLLLD